jgi:hypothetical protein
MTQWRSPERELRWCRFLACAIASTVVVLVFSQSDAFWTKLDALQRKWASLRFAFGLLGLCGAVGVVVLSGRMIAFWWRRRAEASFLLTVVAIASVAGIPVYYWLRLEPELRERVRRYRELTIEPPPASESHDESISG